MNERIAELQDRIVVSVTNAVSRPWESVVVNFELAEVDDDLQDSCLALYFAPNSNVSEQEGFSFPHECYDMFENLCELMRSGRSSHWTVCMLEIRASGKYRFTFSYDPPKRLHGIHDDESMLKNYVPGDW